MHSNMCLPLPFADAALSLSVRPPVAAASAAAAALCASVLALCHWPLVLGPFVLLFSVDLVYFLPWPCGRGRQAQVTTSPPLPRLLPRPILFVRSYSVSSPYITHRHTATQSKSRTRTRTHRRSVSAAVRGGNSEHPVLLSEAATAV